MITSSHELEIVKYVAGDFVVDKNAKDVDRAISDRISLFNFLCI
jgi:hypothetical protein